MASELEELKEAFSKKSKNNFILSLLSLLAGTAALVLHFV